jgi:hypothetical protein
LLALSGPVVVLDARDCEVLGPQLGAVVRGYTARGQVAPERLLELADRVNAAARTAAGSAKPGSVVPGGSRPMRDTVPAGHAAGRDLARSRPGAPVSSSGQPDRLLTTMEAAKAARVGDDYIRRLCRSGTFGTRHSITGAWGIDPRDLAAWIAARSRKETTPEAA